MREIVLAMKNNYKSASWAVVGSSGSFSTTPAAGMDAVDRWGVVADLVWESGGSNHSWIVLSSPSGHPSATKTVYLTIALSTGASNQQDVTFKWDSAAPTGGSLTADPTQSANVATYTDRQVVPSPVSNCKYHLLRNTDGDVLNFVSEDGSGYCAHLNASLKTVNADTGCNYPWIGICDYDDTAQGGFKAETMYTTTRSVMYWQDGTKLTNSQYGCCHYVIVSTKYTDVVDSAGSDISTEYPDFPAILVSRVANKVGNYGALADISWAATAGSVVGGTEAPTGTSNRAIFGEFWVPNGGTTPSF
jgi:hypothetical protein